MRARMLRAIPGFVIATLVAVPVRAQHVDFTQITAAGAVKAYFHSVQPGHDRNLAFASFRAGWTVAKSGRVSVDYLVDLIPLAMTNSNMGVGVAPVGLRAALSLVPRITVGLDVSTAVMGFTHPLPRPQARRLNFGTGGAVDVQLRVREQTAVSLAVVRHHISNAGLSPINPGVDSWMLRAGIVRRRRPRA